MRNRPPQIHVGDQRSARVRHSLVMTEMTVNALRIFAGRTNSRFTSPLVLFITTNLAGSPFGTNHTLLVPKGMALWISVFVGASKFQMTFLWWFERGRFAPAAGKGARTSGGRSLVNGFCS